MNVNASQKGLKVICQFLRALKTGCIFQGKAATLRHSMRICSSLRGVFTHYHLQSGLGGAKPPVTCLAGMEDIFGDCWGLEPAGYPEALGHLCLSITKEQLLSQTRSNHPKSIE